MSDKRSTPSPVVAALARTPLFAAFSDETLRKLAARSTLRQFERDEILFRAGDPPAYLHVLLGGSVQLSAATPGGREAVVELLRPVDVFLMAAALVSQPYLLSARTVEPSQILLIPLDRLLGELRTNPELTLALLGSMARHTVIWSAKSRTCACAPPHRGSPCTFCAWWKTKDMTRAPICPTTRSCSPTASA